MTDQDLGMIFTGKPMNTTSNPFEQDLFIIEKIDSNLEVKKVGKEYILEGIAAIFGEENNNHRIYEEAEYLPHLEYLLEKIKAKRLLGELDHPEKFDISLQNISHMVESLEYMKDKRQVKIRVRLLDTPAGRIAMTLVDAGVPISISSRAAGSVRENKKVQIKKIFTYDLVADPGFEKAQLQRVYESANYDETTSLKNSIIARLDEFNEEFVGKNDNVKIYSIKESEMPMFKKAIENDKKNPSEMTRNFVTVEEMNDYSALIKKQLDKQLDEVKQLIESMKTDATSEQFDGRLAKLEGYTKYLAENLDKNIQYSEYLAENLDKDIEYTKYLAENLDKNITFADYLAENLEKNISYSEYLAENLDRNISYSEYLAENLDRNISYSEYLAENLDRNISYSEYLAENLDRNISYSEYLAENLDRNISYSEYLAENLDRGIGYSEYLAEKLERNIAYSEYIAENFNNASDTPEVKIEQPENKAAEISESITPLFDKNTYSSLSESINALLESAKNQRAVTKLHESQYPFFKFLSEGKREEFLNLDEAKKEKVLGALRNGAYFSEADIVKKWDAAVVENVNTEPLFMQLMPENIKPIWESLSDEERAGTIAASKLRKLDTEYQCRNFWSTRPFVVGKQVGLIKLNENQTPIAAPAKTSSAFTNEYMENISTELGKRFRK